ncbi:unnamed protein product [Lampetra fluviatilis]
MGAKRGNGDAGEGARPPKVARADEKQEKHGEQEEEEFTATRFKQLLQHTDTALRALETFVSLSKQLPAEGLHDVVEGFVKISGECAEIFKLLDGERLRDRELSKVWEALEAILLRTAGDLARYWSVGAEVVRKLLQGHMRLMYSCLSSADARCVLAALKLLCAVVMQGADAARDLFGHFDFSHKSLPYLARRRDAKRKEDIRMAYVRFALSFLISGDANTVRQVLELKDFLIDVFRAGLKEDRVSTVNLLLCTLRQKVVENPCVSKTQKVRFFTAAILNQIAGVFKWDGVDDVSDEDLACVLGAVHLLKTTDGSEAGRALVCDLAYDFLLHLCCSVKTGIAFRDPSLGTSSRSGNLILLQLLLDLRSSVCEEPWTGRLAVELLRACPDLLGRYLQQTDISFMPRARSAWLRNVRFLRQVYDVQPLVSPLFDLPERLALPRAVAVVMVTTTPPVATRAMLTQGLNVPHSVVRHTTLSLISLMLTRMLGSMERCGAGGGGDACDAAGGTAGGGGGPYSQRELQELRTALSEAIGKVLPDVTSLISAWNQISGPVKASEAVPAQEPACEKDEGKGERRNTAHRPQGDGAEWRTAPVAAVLQEGGQLGEVQEMLLKAELLHVLRLYQQVAPHLLAQSSFDFSKLLVGVTSEGTPPILQYRTLQLMLALPVSRYAWFKCRGAADGTGDGSDKSTFYLLLRMFVCSDHPQLQSATQQLLVKILRDSGVFEFTWRELDIWLKGLLDFSREQQEPILTFLEKVVCKVLASPYVYLDKVSEFVQEAATLQNLDSHTPNADACSDVDAGILAELGGEGVEQPLPQDAIAASFPYSALVPCSLQLLLPLLPLQKRGLQLPAHVLRFVVKLTFEVLHSQTEPLTLVLALQALQRPLSDARSEGDRCLPRAALSAMAEFHRYYTPFVPASAREELFVGVKTREADAPTEEEAYGELLERLCWGRHEHLLLPSSHDALLRAATHIPASRLTSATKHTLLYLQHVTQRFLEYDQDTGPQVIAAYGQLLLGIISRAEVLEQGEAERVEERSERETQGEDEVPPQSSTSKILRDVVATVLKHPTLHNLFAVGSGSLALGTGSACPAECLTNAVVSLMCTLLDAPAVGKHGELCGPFLRRLVAGAAAVVSSSAASSSVAAAAVLANFRGLRHLLPTSDVNNLVELLLRLPARSLWIGGDDNNDADAVGDRAERTPDGGRDAAEVRGATGKKGKQRRRRSLKSDGTDSAAVGLTVFGETLAALLERLGTEDLSVLHAAHVRLVLALAVRSRRSELLAPLASSLLSRGGGSVAVAVASVPTHTMGGLLTPGSLLAQPTEAVHLAAGLVACSRSHRAAFELWALRGGGVEALRQHRANLWELLEAYLTHVELADPCRPAHVGEAALRALLPLAWPVLWGGDSDDDAPGSPALLARLLLLPERDCGGAARRAIVASCAGGWESFLSALLARLQGGEHVDWWEVVDVLLPGPFRGVEDRVAEACVRCLITTFSGKQERDKCFETHVLNRLQKLLASDVELPAKLWNIFMKTSLKHRYDDPVTLATVTKVIESCSTVLAPGVLHTMVTGHSLFLPSLLSGEQPARGALVKLLFTLVQKCPNICDIHHFALLLGAYTATLSETDQCLLLLMRIYENNNLSLLDFRLLMWGPEAVSLHATRRTLGRSLWQLPSPDRILGLLDAGRMYETAVNFPLHRTLLPDTLQEEEEFCAAGGSHLYDPAFLLPLFSAILVPECAVDCRRFVEVHGLGLVFAGLASLHPALRGACYHVLTLFHSQLEGSHFPEKPQLLYLLEFVRNGVTQPNMRLSCIATAFLADTAALLLKPEHHMYSRINIFLLSHQYLDSKKIPAFYKFFFSQDVEEREWSLGLLAKGLRDRASLMVCAQHRVLSILMAHHSSPLSSLTTQEHVVRVLSRAAAVPRAASSLVHEGGLLAWLAVLVSRPAVSSRTLGSLVELLHQLWLSVGAAAEEEQQGGGSETGGRSGAGKTKHAISLEIIDEFLHVLLTLLQHNSSHLHCLAFSRCVCTLESLLVARSRFTHDPSPLTSRDIQLLLFAWARVSSSAKLPHHLPTIAFEQAAARDVGLEMGMRKRAPKSALRGAEQQLQREEEEGVEGAEGGGRDSVACAALLSTSRPALACCITFWSPVPERPGSPPLGSERKPPGGTAETLSLALYWLFSDETFLSTMISEKPGSALCIMRWLTGGVTSQVTLLDAVLSESLVLRRLLQLYHGLAEGHFCQEMCGSRLQIMQAFAELFLSFLDRSVETGREKPPSPAGSIPSLCTRSLSKLANAVADKEAVWYLISLCVRESWLGMGGSPHLQSHIDSFLQLERNTPPFTSEEPSVKKHSRSLSLLLSEMREALKQE